MPSCQLPTCPTVQFSYSAPTAMGLLDSVQSFDAFSRIDSEYRVRTRTGAISTCSPSAAGRLLTSVLSSNEPMCCLSWVNFLKCYFFRCFRVFERIGSLTWLFEFSPISRSVSQFRFLFLQCWKFHEIILFHSPPLAVSLVAMLIMSILFVTELRSFLTSDIKPELYVDTTLGELIQINLDVVFPSLPCSCASPLTSLP